MIFTAFEVPQMTDNVNLLNQTQKGKMQPLSHQLGAIGKINQSRSTFKNIINNFCKQGQYGENINQKKEQLKQYLGQSVDLIQEMCGLKGPVSLPFQYKSNFLIKRKKALNIGHCSQEEACAVEAIMARYIYAIAFNEKDFGQSQAQLKYFLVKPGDVAQETVDNNMLFDKQSAYIFCGWKQLKKVSVNYQDLNQSFNTMNPKIPELEEFCINGVLKVLECNANFFKLNKMKAFMEPSLNQAQTAKCCSVKLTQAHQMFSTYQGADKNLLDYCKWASFFYKAYAIYQYILYLQECGKMSMFPSGKDYRATMAATVALTQKLQQMQQTAQACPKNLQPIVASLNFYYGQIWNTLCYKIQEVYKDMMKENLKNPNLCEVIYNEIQFTEQDDFCERHWKNQNP